MAFKSGTRLYLVSKNSSPARSKSRCTFVQFLDNVNACSDKLSHANHNSANVQNELDSSTADLTLIGVVRPFHIQVTLTKFVTCTACNSSLTAKWLCS